MQSKAYEFDEIANGPFSPIYPVIARQIIEKTGINTGLCLDLGSGGGHLGLSLIQIADMKVVLLDKVEEALEIASKRAKSWGLENRASTLLADVQQIPLMDESVNLCISRGSIWFWEDQKMGLEEIYRVLAEDGMAYIGGGFGNKELEEQVYKKMKVRDSEWPNKREKFIEGNTVEHFTAILNQIGISDFEITDDERGMWVLFKKRKNKKCSKLNFVGYTYCPLKLTFKESFEEVMTKYMAETGDRDFRYYVPSGCGGDDPCEDLWKAESIDQIPEIIASVGFGDFFREEFVERFVQKGHFRAVEYPGINKAFAAAGFLDPDRQYTIYSVFPLVMLIDKRKLGALPVPKQWKDLLNPAYINNIIIGASHGDIHEDLLLYIYKEHGDEGINKLAPNIKAGWHASQMAKTAGTNSSEGAAIYVIPWMFAKSCPRTEATEIIWPLDGSLTTPNYILVKQSALPKYNIFINFLTGTSYGQKSADNYFPVMNAQVNNKLSAGATFKWLGWDYIKSHSMEELKEHVIKVFQQHWKRAGGVKEEAL